MPMSVREIKTSAAIKAVNKIKSHTKKDGLELQLDIPKVCKEKREYKQSDEFIKDEHNAQMLKYGEKLIELREKIALNIAERNKTSKDEIVQGINGFSRIKKHLDANKMMNFSKSRTFYNHEEIEYGILREFKIGNLVRQAKMKLGLK